MSDKQEVSLREMAEKYPLKPPQQPKKKSLFDRFLSLPGKVAGSFLGIDSTVIERKMRTDALDSQPVTSHEPSVSYTQQSDNATIDSVRSDYLEAYAVHQTTGGPMVIKTNTTGLSQDQVRQAILEAEALLDSAGYKR